MVPHVPQPEIPRHGGIFSVIFPAGRPVLHAPSGRSRLVRPRSGFRNSGFLRSYGSRPSGGRERVDPLEPGSHAAALKEGKPVYVDFTARWCSTCQVNKASYTDEVLAAFRKYGIVMMKADKTRTNPAIDQELKNLGRTAVPVNALYLPGKKPVVTRELLSPSYLLEFLETEMDR